MSFTENAGWGLIVWGLAMIVLWALLALLREPDAPSDAFFWAYTVSFAAIWHGFQLLRRAGAWPPPHANRS